MKSKIDYAPDEVWDLFCEDIDKYRDRMVLIASNDDCNVQIYLTGEQHGPRFLPSIVVFMDDTEVFSECAVNETDCEQTVEMVYEDYLEESKVIGMALASDDIEETERDIQEMEIDARERELSDAVWQFFVDILGSPLSESKYENAGKILDDCKEHFLEYIARKWGLKIFRPMYLEDEDGEEFYEEYPYECIVFDD